MTARLLAVEGSMGKIRSSIVDIHQLLENMARQIELVVVVVDQPPQQLENRRGERMRNQVQEVDQRRVRYHSNSPRGNQVAIYLSKNQEQHIDNQDSDFSSNVEEL